MSAAELRDENPIVLVIEDDLSIQKTVEKILKKEHLNVLAAYNGLDALGILKATIPDLILMDVIMPEMDGEQTLRAIRKRIPSELVPVMMVTGNSDPNIIRKFLKLGCQNYIVKPVAGKTLVEKVDIYLRGQLPSGRQRLHSKSLALAQKVMDSHNGNIASFISHQAAMFIILESPIRRDNAIPFSLEKLAAVAKVVSEFIDIDTFLEATLDDIHKTADLDARKLTQEMVSAVISECERLLQDDAFHSKLD